MILTKLRLAAVTAAAVLLAPVAHAQDVTPEDARTIAKEAYTYG
jgi:predicted outer membrane protein